MKKAFILIICLFIGWFFYDIYTQPGVKDLEGDFRQISFVRNENNTGPVVRLYAVAVNDTLWTEMMHYGKMMPHTKYGNTKVFFFLKHSPLPEKLILGDTPIPTAIQQYCIARYEKDGMGNISLVKFPFNSQN
jgi:hypothetical protein